MRSDVTKEYVDSVCGRIRWKKAADNVAKELENHIADQKNLYIEYGLDEDTAERKAVEQMGDPLTVGDELDKIHRPEPQIKMAVLAALIFLSGVAIRAVGGISPAEMLVPAVIAAVAFAAAYRCDCQIPMKYGRYMCIIMIAVGLLMMAGSGVNGFDRFVLTEVNKVYSIISPLLFSCFVYSQRGRGEYGIICSAVCWIALAAILVFITSFAGLTAIAFTAAIEIPMLIKKGWFGEEKKKYTVLVTVLAGIAVVAFLLYILVGVRSGYYLSRIKTILFPESEAMGAGYVTMLTRNIVKNAVLIGQVSTTGSFAEITVPSFDTDCFLTYIIYRFGWLVFAVITAAFAVFIAVGFYKTFKQKSVIGFAVCFPVMASFTVQTVIYTMANLGFRVFSVVSMPLFSYGNTALVLNMALIGLMLSVFRTSLEQRDLISERNKMVIFEKNRMIIELK
ncbi:MAG: permease prefix domain 1-containing protein [Clostridia bacterium]|nr:permease prefix domain 1-containing protein [Clostridia bacterium]